MDNPTKTVETLDHEIWTEVMLRHIFYGVFFWEFFTTLEYEWKAVRGHIPYRWTIWIYSVSRVACLMGLILSAVLMNLASPLNCQVLMYSQRVFFYLAFATASLLIVLRISAIWNRNNVAVAVAVGVWLINVGFLIQGAACYRVKSYDFLPPFFCIVQPSLGSRLAIISLAATDIFLLLIMLVGLFRMRHDGYASFGLAQLLWKQGVIWISLATVVEIPAAMSAILNLNLWPTAVTYLASLRAQQLSIPTIVAMTIAATRMHRSLVDFATPDIMRGNFQASAVKFSKTKQIRAAPVPLNPMVTPMYNVLQQHPTRQMN